MFSIGVISLTITALRLVAGKPPHIIFIMADDLGWNDVSFHGSPEIPTPNIDALAASGIVLHNYYATPQCTPSRGSLMTGKYPINTGLQHYVIKVGEPSGLPLDFKIMPQYFKNLGYATHMIGKWHLGCYKTEYFPTKRGFDSFFGYMNGYLDYYDYTHFRKINDDLEFWGVDLYKDTTLIRNQRGKYSTDVFTDRAVEIITQHPKSKPLFLYMAEQAPHTGNDYFKLQAPPEEVAKLKHIENEDRRTYAAMVSKLDESVGRIFAALNSKGMLDNSIVIFSSDNGGVVDPSAGASNWPLRGAKLGVWEGGVRVPALIWSPLLQLKEPRVSMQLMHISDWLPTLYHAASGNVKDLENIDGFNMWQHFIDNSPSPRMEMVLNIDPIADIAGLRFGDYKLVTGIDAEKSSYWYGQTDNTTSSEELLDVDGWVWKDGSNIKDIMQNNGWWLIKEPNSWRMNLSINCGEYRPEANTQCDPNKGPCLFNVVRDPCEYENIAVQFPKIVRTMMQRIRRYNSTAIPPLSKPIDLHADPRCFGFGYAPWLDDELRSDCPYL